MNVENGTAQLLDRCAHVVEEIDLHNRQVESRAIVLLLEKCPHLRGVSLENTSVDVGVLDYMSSGWQWEMGLRQARFVLNFFFL